MYRAPRARAGAIVGCAALLVAGCGQPAFLASVGSFSAATSAPPGVPPAVHSAGANGVSGVGTTGGAPPTAVPVSIRGHTAILGIRNSGATITVPIGTEISVELGAATQPPYTWTVVTSTNPAVLQPGSATEENGGSVAAFSATALGVSVLSASDNPACHMCGLPSELWEVTVHVDPPR
jgi:hypothetical protein